jgi:mono/diheme cytochrome c family protein
MKRIALSLSVMLLGIGVAQAESLLPGDAVKGKATHAANCGGCHDTGVYARKERTIKSLGGLKQRVQMCNGQLRRNLNADQITDIVKYLNDGFYKFD